MASKTACAISIIVIIHSNICITCFDNKSIGSAAISLTKNLVQFIKLIADIFHTHLSMPVLMEHLIYVKYLANTNKQLYTHSTLSIKQMKKRERDEGLASNFVMTHC